jgi:menaquinone-dependent protoporphyrinogen oxidase
MRVLVVYASRHGATSGIAERLATVLTAEGLTAEIHPVGDARIIERAGHLDRYDAFVIGSAVYAFHWIGEARDFVRQNLDLLRSRPVWLFGSGPLGDKTTDDKGHDLLKPPPEMAELAERVQARGSRVFFGAWDPDAKPIGVMERVMHVLPAAKDALPAGDFRNWDEIEAWARSIAHDLAAIPVPA